MGVGVNCCTSSRSETLEVVRILAVCQDSRRYWSYNEYVLAVFRDCVLQILPVVHVFRGSILRVLQELAVVWADTVSTARISCFLYRRYCRLVVSILILRVYLKKIIVAHTPETPSDTRTKSDVIRTNILVVWSIPKASVYYQVRGFRLFKVRNTEGLFCPTLQKLSCT